MADAPYPPGSPRSIPSPHDRYPLLRFLSSP
uniref:Uncharacterized protein n=1 Tax=Arundo donax TaxID=35708 RepID=A0A0A8Y713_ARUDO